MLLNHRNSQFLEVTYNNQLVLIDEWFKTNIFTAKYINASTDMIIPCLANMRKCTLLCVFQMVEQILETTSLSALSLPLGFGSPLST